MRTELCSQVAEPDRLAKFMAEQGAAIWSHLARVVPAAEVDDLQQEVLIKALRAWPKFRGESDVATWLYRIAQRTAVDYLRSRYHSETRRTDSLALDQDPESEIALPVATLIEPAVATAKLERHEMHDCVREYVARLPLDYRQVIELKDFSGLTNADISARLGISVGAVKIRLHRARTALRGLLADSCEFYQSDTDSLACDRLHVAAPVSFATAISSKEVQPAIGTCRAERRGHNINQSNPMSSQSSCGCSAPETCAPTASLFTPIAAEFVALGAAIGANCEPCLRYHVREALKLGIPATDIAKAVATAEQVKATPARAILKLAEHLTQSGGFDTGTPQPAGEGCGCAA